MSEILTRAVETHVEVGSKSGKYAGRTIVGVAVPYGVAQRISADLTEEFARGAFSHQLPAAHRIPLFAGHQAHGGAHIGRALSLRETDDALIGEWVVSETERGRETLALLRDEALSHLSVAFRARTDRRLPNGVVQRVKADLVETSLVLQGAYGDGASVSEIRGLADDGTPTELVTPNLDQVRAILEGL